MAAFRQAPTSLPASSTSCRVVLLSDVRLYREGILRALEPSTALQVLAAAPLDEVALAIVRDAQPDIVLLEAAAARSPATVQAILAAASNTKVIAIAIGDEESDAIICAE